MSSYCAVLPFPFSFEATSQFLNSLGSFGWQVSPSKAPLCSPKALAASQVQALKTYHPQLQQMKFFLLGPGGVL